ncbi:MAG: hypothetical protein QOH70_2689 [Blastocatellia bacterium]|jgi:hypothetical protein|nr:hypothetical protein [Blastocatellia bacterium]
MPFYRTVLPQAFRLATLILCVLNAVTGATLSSRTKVDTLRNRSRFVELRKPTTIPVNTAGAVYKWNLNEKGLSLLGLPNNHLTAGLDQSLSYPLDQFSFPIFQALSYDDEHTRYLLPSLLKESKGVHFIEFAPAESKNTYTSTDGANIKLTDNDTMKTVRTSDGTRYIFVRYPDGEFRCATIKDSSGASLNLLYTANGLMLHGVVDSAGRTITFNYGSEGIKSLTQTWMANSEGLTKTWMVGEQPENALNPEMKFSHSVASAFAKTLPSNAIVREYTPAMATSDKSLAHIFGGPNAVAGANGFEPAGLAAAYPFYRGDIIGDDGIERRGHLSFAMHLYGSPDGTGDSRLYVPAGFTQHSDQPSPVDAAVIFYYPRLGNLTDVTLAVFHVADFQISSEGDRVWIGSLGGPGGSSASYKHSHIEFYRGNTGLPPLAARPGLRIDPTTVFATSNSPGK